MLGFPRYMRDRDFIAPEGRSRRRHPRVVCLGRAFASIGAGQEGSVINLSLGGLLLRLKRELTLGSSYFIKLFFDSEIAVAEARVVRLVTRNDDSLAGMQFIRLSSRDTVALQSFMGPEASHW